MIAPAGNASANPSGAGSNAGSADTLADEDDNARASAARIRPSRPTIGGGPDYQELVIVDPAHYAVSREIARGGMGRIQIARDRRLGREVALKEILVDRDSVRRRFEREARITARLQHPSIVGVLEAGMWPSGEPFFAMPLLAGRPLEDAFDEAVTFERRIALLPNVLAIADAMAYAHGKRVIHRDLKPRNVIVGEYGETVVIDWGIAKELDVHDSLSGHSVARRAAGGDTGDGNSAEPGTSEPPGSGAGSGSQGETTVGDVLGTPAYMPPEQAAGQAVDERADVYAIGAILYHLLTGVAPFIADGKTALLATVQNNPPRPVTELAPQTPRELLAIVQRAMAHDPAKRYATARELADDLRRFQTGKLVAAHRYSTGQRLRRWIGRHRTAVAAVSAAAIVTIVIGVVALNRIMVAHDLVERQRALALANQNRAEDLLRFMLVDLREKLQKVGRLELLDSVARRAAEHYDARGDATSDEDLYLSSLARDGIGAVLAKRGDLALARVQFDKARAGFEQLAARRPDEVKYVTRAALATYAVARIINGQGDLKISMALTREGLARVEPLLAAHAGNKDLVKAVFDGHNDIAGLLEDLGDADGALTEYRKLLELASKHATITDDEVTHRRLLTVHSSIGRILRKTKHDYVGAITEYRKGLAIGELLLSRDPKNLQRVVDVAISRNQLANVLLDQEKPDDALVEIRLAIPQFERAIQGDPTNADWYGHLGTGYERLGMAMFAKKDYAAAKDAYTKMNEIWSDQSKRDPTNTDLERSRTLALNKLGDVQAATKDTTGALASYRAALAIRERLVAKDPSNASWRRDRFYSHIKLAEAYLNMGDHKREVLAELRIASELAQENLAIAPTNGGFVSDVVGTRKNVGELLADLGDHAAARTELEAALALARESAPLLASKSSGDTIKKIEALIAKLPPTKRP